MINPGSAGMLTPAHPRFIFGSAHALLEELSESADDQPPPKKS
jgi:hypothetical protein